MLSILVQFILVHYAIILIADKNNLQKRLLKISQKLGAKKLGKHLGKFIYEVQGCVFCLTHHVGVFILPFLFMTNGFNWVFFIYPLMSTSALYLITKHDKK